MNRIERRDRSVEVGEPEPAGAGEKTDPSGLEAVDESLEAIEAEGDVDEVALISGELAEDLRRAQPNPPLVVPRAADPRPEVDLGSLEDHETQSLDEEGVDEEVPLRAVDPLYAERESRERPNPSAGPMPGQVDTEEG